MFSEQHQVTKRIFGVITKGNDPSLENSPLLDNNLSFESAITSLHTIADKFCKLLEVLV